MVDFARGGCWCGKAELDPWNEDYARCPICETLVYVKNDCQDVRVVADDGTSLYDADYWLEKMLPIYKKAGYSTIDDIILFHYRERAAYWMQHFLQFVLPPARVLEIGCGLGTFCHWLKHLGFSAEGTEMSPAWRATLQEKLGISVSDYKLGTEPHRTASLDAVALFDLLEHISSPLDFFKGLASELKKEGVIVIQTPQYDGDSSYEELSAKQHPFLRQLLPNEHVFLYSEAGIKQLLHRFGFTHIRAYPSLFPADMFLFASRAPLRFNSEAEIDSRLTQPNSIAAYAALKNWQCSKEPAMENPSLFQKVKGKIRHAGKKLVGR